MQKYDTHTEMKKRTILLNVIWAMMCSAMLLMSCGSKPADEEQAQKSEKQIKADEEQAHKNERLIKAIARYVTCPTDSVELMLASADSICQLVDTCSIEILGLGNEEINSRFDSLYHKEIPTILKLYGTYDVVTSNETNEANAAFAWHEVANALIADYAGKEEIDTTDVENMFMVVDDLLLPYFAGSQADMNVSAWREIMMYDYWLIDEYIRLYESCNDPSMLKSIHGSYMHLMETYNNRSAQIDEYYTDLPRELASMLAEMMDERRIMIRNIHAQYREGKLTKEEVKAELDKRPEDVEWDIYDY